jgi:hypothetical protein
MVHALDSIATILWDSRARGKGYPYSQLSRVMNGHDREFHVGVETSRKPFYFPFSHRDCAHTFLYFFLQEVTSSSSHVLL